MNKHIFFLAVLALGAVACGDDEGDGDDGVVIKTDAATPIPDSGIGGSIDAGGLDSGTNNNAGDGGGTVIKGYANCFQGKPSTSLEYLNACAEGYVEFDNAKRLPSSYKNGALPPLQ